MRTILDAEALTGWAALALDGMKTHRRAIDALNVFPVPDGDTGTNMYLTLEAGVAAMMAIEGDVPEPGNARLAALARGMLLGARGNSGVIMSELLRGIAATRAADLTRPMDGSWLADALTRASSAAFSAVSNPKEGTVLTVARAAATAATEIAAETDGDLQAVTKAAAEAARTALAGTTAQLEALRRAGVVDAGGRGYVVLTDALLEVVTGVHSDLPEFARLAPEPDSLADPEHMLHGYGGPAYEVMYLLDAPDEAIPGFKARLAGLGDSLVVVGGDSLWNIHVHVDDAGAAVEAALAIGAPYRIRITYLAAVVDAGGEPHGARAGGGGPRSRGRRPPGGQRGDRRAGPRARQALDRRDARRDRGHRGARGRAPARGQGLPARCRGRRARRPRQRASRRGDPDPVDRPVVGCRRGP